MFTTQNQIIHHSIRKDSVLFRYFFSPLLKQISSTIPNSFKPVSRNKIIEEGVSLLEAEISENWVDLEMGVNLDLKAGGSVHQSIDIKRIYMKFEPITSSFDFFFTSELGSFRIFYNSKDDVLTLYMKVGSSIYSSLIMCL